MNKLIVYTSTLHDKAGFPVCSLNGDLEFIFNTYKQSIDNANVTDDLKKMLQDGTVRLHSVTVACIDDNSVNLNHANTEKIDFVFNINQVDFPFDIKKFSHINKKDVKAVNSIVARLERVCKNVYDFNKKLEVNNCVDKENCN